MTPLRLAAFITLLLALIAAGVGLISTHAGSEQLEAELAAAEAGLRRGDHAAAAGVARDVLAREPVTGRAFALLARAAEDATDPSGTRSRYQVAARRAPRDAGVRAWLAADALQSGEYAAAIDHLDALLTVAPGQRAGLLKLIAQLSREPAFAESLADHLLQQPRHRVAILRAATAMGLAASDNLHGALRARGGLDDDDVARWIEGMIREGRWGSAYARWASGMETAPERLPVPWNGDFRQSPSSAGFDWRQTRVPGVLFDRIELPGGKHAARLRFLGRPVAQPGLGVPLLLGPGEHVLRVRVRTVGLRSDQGLEWTLACADGRTRIASGARVTEAPDWVELEMPFTVPGGEGCEGQWLRLVNPAPRGVAQTLRGELHITDVMVGS